MSSLICQSTNLSAHVHEEDNSNVYSLNALIAYNECNDTYVHIVLLLTFDTLFITAALLFQCYRGIISKCGAK